MPQAPPPITLIFATSLLSDDSAFAIVPEMDGMGGRKATSQSVVYVEDTEMEVWTNNLCSPGVKR